MRRLGIDHGEKRVGLALSDEDGVFAQPFDTLARAGMGALVTEVAALVEAQGVQEIVVGLPLHMDGREGASARRARRFAEKLEAATGKPVILWDERMSSLAAERALREGGLDGKAQRGKVDRVAASLLLQSYLDSQRGRDDAWGADGSARAEADGSPEG